MMSSAPAYGAYAKNVLLPSMDPAVVHEIQELESAEDFSNPRYEALLMEHHYQYHVLRKPLDQWPDSVMRALEHRGVALAVILV